MHKLTFFLLLTFFLNCKRAIPPTDGSNLCNTVGKIVDYTDLLDGCTFLIELENGERFNPIKMSVEGFEFKDGQKIKFGYIELEDMMSTCMAESAFVEITCIEDLNKSSNNDFSTVNLHRYLFLIFISILNIKFTTFQKTDFIQTITNTPNASKNYIILYFLKRKRFV